MIELSRHIHRRIFYKLVFGLVALLLALSVLIPIVVRLTDSTSAAGGFTWTQDTDGYSDSWYDISASNDGQKVFAGSSIRPYVSSDGGATWVTTDLPSASQWIGAVSGDGSKIIALPDGYYAHISEDGGDTWTPLSVGSFIVTWTDVAMSANGQKIVASTNFGLYISSDGGATWSEKGPVPSTGWQSVAVSDDGTKIAVGMVFGSIYTSSDGGDNWVQNVVGSGSGQWYAITSSADGNILTAAGFSAIYRSNNAGASWSLQSDMSGTGGWRGLASSNDGSRLIGVKGGVSSGYIYSSVDGGINWLRQDAAGLAKWKGLIMVRDTSRVFAGSEDSAYMWQANFEAVLPQAPTSLSLSDPTRNTVDLDWTAPQDNGGSQISDYRVEYSSNGGSSWNVFSHEPSINTEITVTGLQAGTNYSFRVGAVNSVGIGFYSNTQAISTTPAVAPAQPTNGSVESRDGRVVVKWSAPVNDGGSALTFYEVSYKKSSESVWQVASSSISASSTSYTVSGLQNDVSYDFRVRAVNGVGAGEWSEYRQEIIETPFEVRPSILWNESFRISSDGIHMAALTYSANGLWVSGDAGDTWTQHLSGVYLSTVEVSPDGSRMYAASTSNIYVSNNYGSDWSVLGYDIPGSAQSIAFGDNWQNVYIVSTSGVMYWSSNGGTSFVQIDDPENSQYMWSSVGYHRSQDILYAIKTDGGTFDTALVKSNDNGQNWQDVRSASQPELILKINVNQSSGELVTGDLDFGNFTYGNSRSFDAGASWVKFTPLILAVGINPDGYYYLVDGDYTHLVNIKGRLSATPTSEGSEPEPEPGPGTKPPKPSTGGPSASRPNGGSTSNSGDDSSKTIVIKVDDIDIDGDPVISSLPVFSGYAYPYAQITVTVHSDPVSCSTVADDTGFWSCQLSVELPAGSHSVYVYATNPETNEKEEYGPYPVVVNEDKVVDNGSDNKEDIANDSGFNMWLILAGVGMVIVVIIILLIARAVRWSQAK